MKHFIVFFGFLLPILAYGQDPRPGLDRIPGAGSNPDALIRKQFRVPQDTSPILYFFAENPELLFEIKDSTLSTSFFQYYPTRLQPFGKMTLGNLGSAHSDFVWEPLEKLGLDIGLHQYDLYQRTPKKTRYFNVDQPYTQLEYYLGGEQSDGYISTAFSRNFSKGTNFSLDYQRISQLGRTSQYPNQNTRNTSLNAGFQMRDSTGRYRSFFTFSTNTIEAQDNGGITEPPIKGGEFYSPSSASVQLEEAQTRHAHNALGYTQFYALRNRDTAITNQRAYEVMHQIIRSTSLYKYFDDSPFPEYYEGFTNGNRGARFWLHHRKFENQFKIRTRKSEGINTTIQRDLVEASLIHQNHRLNLDGSDSTINNLILKGSVQWQPWEGVTLDTRAHLGLWDQAGDYEIDGRLSLVSKKLGEVSLFFNNRLYSPTFVQNYFQVTREVIWNQKLSKTLATSFGGTIFPLKTGLKVTGRYFLFNNLIYFDEQAMPTQESSPVSLFQITIQNKFRVGAFHLENALAFQKSTNDKALRLPTLYAQHSLYYYGRWFGVLNVRFGLDLRHHTPFYSNYYHPLTGQFILQNEKNIAYYPAVDGYLGIRVTRFRAFIQWVNLTQTVWQGLPLEHSATYLHPEGLRLGITWRLIN